jgi:hypothetical protein
MENMTTVVLVVLLLAALGLAAWAFTQKRRTEELRDRFGPEYERAVHTTGDTRQAQAELEARQKRVEALNIRTLDPDERQRFADRWQATQAHFVDDPSGAIQDANDLVKDVMEARGYPVSDFEQRAADISVNHADVVTHYRAARAIALANERGEADTENLRQAMVHYRALFEELLEAHDHTPKEVAHR